MNGYQLRLLLEAVATIYSVRELHEDRDISKNLSRNLGLAPAGAEALVDGAYQLKTLRQSAPQLKGASLLQ